MNLKTLLTGTLSFLLLFTMATVFILNLKSFQDFIEKQVYSTTQDTVYSLGISLATLPKNAPLSDIELMVNAVFDSGYYEYIRVYDVNDKLIYEDKEPVVVKDVPAWFIKYMPITLHEATGKITKGWQQKGRLAIKGHAGYAYYQLYKEFLNLLLLFSIITIISLGVLIFLINSLLHTLKSIKEQANGINEHKFIIDKKRVYINDFALLKATMNQMVEKVESIFTSQVKTFEELQNVLYKDEETQLPNKKYFILKLKEILEDETKEMGYLAVISIDGLERLKTQKSYAFYKETLLELIKTIPVELSKNNLVSRINENEIAILFQTGDIEKIQKHFESLQDALSISSRDTKSHEKLFCASVGVAPFFKGDKTSQALSRLDYALSRAQTNGCNIIEINDDKENKNELITMGKNYWKEMFEKIFSENKIVLAMQSVINIQDNHTYHKEVLLRIQEDDGSLNTAGYYLPMAHTLGLVAKFDKVVIEDVAEKLATYKTAVALNISKNFVLQSKYFLELRNTLSSKRKSNPGMLHFECAENDILSEIESYIAFAEMVHAHKQLFGIDRFTGIENLRYLEKIRPNYIKIDVNFVLESLHENESILVSLDTLSKVMGITLIVTAVENEEQVQLLTEKGYRYFQGRYIADIEV